MGPSVGFDAALPSEPLDADTKIKRGVLSSSSLKTSGEPEKDLQPEPSQLMN